jgi:pyruvate dehydrogenase (quinone)
MKAAGIVTYGTDLDNPDFAPVARGVGLSGARVEKAGDLEAALHAAFTHDGPALVDVAIARQELSLPPKLSYGQIKGFTRYATRTILSGEELVELAKTNLRQPEIDEASPRTGARFGPQCARAQRPSRIGSCLSSQLGR